MFQIDVLYKSVVMVIKRELGNPSGIGQIRSIGKAGYIDPAISGSDLAERFGTQYIAH